MRVILFCVAMLVPSLLYGQQPFDVVIYGGTSGGVAAAVQARRMGKTVLLIEPGRHLGGLSSGGLGATDIGNKGAIGGISREFYQRVNKHYSQPDAWTHEQPEQYRSGRQSEAAKEDAMWTFEPHVAEQIMNQMVRESGAQLVMGERLDLNSGVEKDGDRILAITMESGKTFQGKRFIDATYEGDLMATAGVSYHVGREANVRYGETFNGVQTINATKHQFIVPVDPYVKPGDKSSGVLYGIDPTGPGREGSGDHRVQTYNLRLCATTVPANRVAWPKPQNYDPARYELLLRNLEAGDHRIPWNPVMMPNKKTDANNNYAVSTDYIGQNYSYPDADHETRDQIFSDHLSYTQGLFWTLANDPRVPEEMRAHFQNWGLAKDEFQDNGHWPHQMYVREARRMVSDYVMTQHDCQGRNVAEDAVGLGAYNMDSHNVQRYIDEAGHVRNEGDIQVGVSPYPISYRSIVPKDTECSNLLVPVCLAASHIAYGSIRMEPVFMVLGQSAATAACQSIDADVAVQAVDYAALRERLLADGQVLEWTGPRRQAVASLDPAKLPGIVLDDQAMERTGEWLTSTSAGSFVGPHYWHDDNSGKGEKARFLASIDAAGQYEVLLAYTPNPNRATNVPVTIHHASGETKVTVNQQETPPIDKAFLPLGVVRLEAGQRQPVVTVTNTGTNGHVIVDAVLLVPQKSPSTNSGK